MGLEPSEEVGHEPCATAEASTPKNRPYDCIQGQPEVCYRSVET